MDNWGSKPDMSKGGGGEWMKKDEKERRQAPRAPNSGRSIELKKR